jgi:tRNA nucleotidyltransferase/poly(A) polymerase
MESRFSPEQMQAVNTVQQIARSHGMNIYLTGGAVRDIFTGFPIRDLDLTVQGNPLKLQHEIEKSGGIVDMVDSAFSVIHVIFQGVQVEITMARAEVFDKPGKLPLVTPATINEDLRRRDFTFNAMALSLNDGSRGLLLDPFNGAADIEARLIRILHSYSFLEDPSRLIRAVRFATRFGWELDERTRARYDSAREGNYIDFIGSRAVGYEIEQIAHEEQPIAVMRALESEGWLKVLWPKWTVAKADVPELAQLLKSRALMADFNINADAAPAVMHFLTFKLGAADIAAIQRLLPHREFVASWKRLDNDAKELTKKLVSKEAALNSGAWKILSSAKPEALLYLEVTGSNKTADEKIKNFLGKWRQVQEKIPFAQMAELRITPQLPEYPRIYQEAFLLLLDGKLRSDAEVMKFLAPFEPPPPPPPPTPMRRGRAAAKKAPVVVKAVVQQATETVPDAAPLATAPRNPAVAPKVVVESKSTPPKLPSEKKISKVLEVKAKPVAGKKPGAEKPAAKVAKSPVKAVLKPVAKTQARKAPKPAPKSAKSAKPAVKSTKADKTKNKKPAHKAPEKKMHGKKKPEKAHSKHR